MFRHSDAPARYRLRLMLAFEAYLTATLLIYLFGPLALPEPHVVTVALLVLAYQAALFAGFLLAERLAPLGAGSRPPATNFGRGRGLIIVPVALGGTLSVFFSYASLSSYAQSWNPLRLLTSISRSIQNPAAAYAANHAVSAKGGTWITGASTLAAPLTFAAFVLGLYYFRKLPLAVRALVVTDGLLQLLTAVIRGMNFGVFKVTAVVLTVALLSLLNRMPRRSPRRRTLYARAAALGLTLVAFLGYFSVTTGDRLSAPRPSVIAGIPIDYTSPLISHFPESLQQHAALLSLYLGQGYHGFSLTLDYPFSSTYGLGNGMFVMDNLKQLFGWDLFQRTYIHKMDPVWSESQNWHTAYTWFANDVGLWGVAVVMFAVGGLFNIVLQGAMREDALAVALLPLFLMMMFFLPANNVVISNPLTCMPFVILGATYVLLLAHHRSRDRPISLRRRRTL